MKNYLNAKRYLKIGDTVKLSDLQVGDIFKASDIEWMVVAKNHKGYPVNSVTVISQDILEKRAFDKHIGKFGSNHWGNSDLRKYLNGEFYNKLDPSFRAAILETNLGNIENKANNNNYNKYGAPGYNGETYYTKDKIFIPSLEELGLKDISYGRKVGEDYGAFRTNESRIAKLNSNTEYYWVRVPYCGYSYYVCRVDSGGSNYYGNARNESVGVRAALNLKSDIPLEYAGNNSLIYNNENKAYKIQLGAAANTINNIDLTNKNSLITRLNAVQKYIDTENAYKAQLTTATNAVVKAENSKLQVDVDIAMALVKTLKDSDKTTCTVETRTSKMSNTIKLSELCAGDIFEASGIEWVVAAKNHEGYPDSSITVMSKDVLEKRAFDNHVGKFGSNYWGNSDLRKYLNGEFYNKLDPSFKAAILETNLENIENGANNYSYNDKYGAPSYSGKTYYTQDEIFIPSLEELGLKNINWAKPVGTDYGAFKTDISRTAKLNGENYCYLTRTPYWSYSYHGCIVGSDGSYHINLCANNATVGIRPTLNLRSDIPLEYA